jgi:hypothetical protein
MRIQPKLKSRATTKSALTKCADTESCVIQLRRSWGNTSIERERLDEIGLRRQPKTQRNGSFSRPITDAP